MKGGRRTCHLCSPTNAGAELVERTGRSSNTRPSQRRNNCTFKSTQSTQIWFFITKSKNIWPNIVVLGCRAGVSRQKVKVARHSLYSLILGLYLLAWQKGISWVWVTLYTCNFGLVRWYSVTPWVLPPNNLELIVLFESLIVSEWTFWLLFWMFCFLLFEFKFDLRLA